MTVRLAARAALTAVLTMGVVWAQAPVAPQFRFERVINAGSGPHRLAIDVPILVGSQPFSVTMRPGARPDQARFAAAGGLGDLRLFDQSGREVPYLFVAPSPPADEWVRGRVLPLAATKTTSGFEVELDEPRVIDRILVDGVRAPFLKRVMVEGSGDRAHWTVLLPQATVFDLPEQGLRQTELAFPRGTYRYVRATWDDTNSAVMALPSAVSARVVPATVAEAPTLTLTLSATRLAGEPGRSRYDVVLPAARLPIVALEPQADASYVFREAVVTESRLAARGLAPARLGTALLRQVVRDQLTASSMAIPISPPTEPQLNLSIEDGDNPPLAMTRVVARFAELPWIYFETTGGAIVARWGDPRLHEPQYDLEAARASIKIDAVPDASWGDVRALTPPAPVSPPTPMPNTGAPLDVKGFRYSRAIPSAETGLIAVPLDAAVLAHSTGVLRSFGDIRIADANGRQVPYLVELRDGSLTVDLKIEPRAAPASEKSQSAGTRTYYRVRLPYANLTPWTLALTTTATVFQRQVVLGIERPADAAHRDPWRETIATEFWAHADREKPAPALMLRGNDGTATDLVIEIHEGDNSPLPLTSARLLLPSYRVRLFHDPGVSLRLLYGRDDIGSPSYDLALLAPTVLGVPAREVVAEAEQPLAGGGRTTVIGSPRVFWGVLIVAVVALLALLVKLIRRET